MLKLLGSLCVLGGGVLAWSAQRRERRRKRDTLSDLLRALRRMGEAIRIARTPLPPLLDSAASDCGPGAAAFFSAAARGLRDGESLSDAWKEAVKALPLSEGDRQAVADLGGELQGDEEKVCKAISLVIYQLAKSAEEQDQGRRELEKQAAALWFSAAALLVIFQE